MYASLLGGYPIGTTTLPYRQIADERRARQQYAHCCGHQSSPPEWSFSFTLPIVRHRIKRRVHPRREVQQFSCTFDAFWQKLKSPRVANTQPTLFCAGDVAGKKAYISSHWKAHTGLLPRYARKLAGLNATTQQSQPQFGIEPTVEKNRC